MKNERQKGLYAEQWTNQTRRSSILQTASCGEDLKRVCDREHMVWQIAIKG